MVSTAFVEAERGGGESGSFSRASLPKFKLKHRLLQFYIVSAVGRGGREEGRREGGWSGGPVGPIDRPRLVGRGGRPLPYYTRGGALLAFHILNNLAGLLLHCTVALRILFPIFLAFHVRTVHRAYKCMRLLLHLIRVQAVASAHELGFSFVYLDLGCSTILPSC